MATTPTDNEPRTGDLCVIDGRVYYLTAAGEWVRLNDDDPKIVDSHPDDEEITPP